MGVKPPFVPFPIVAAVAHRRGRLVRPDADVLRGDPARRRRQRDRHRARRLVAAQGQGGAVRARRPVRRAVGHGAGRHHDLGRRQYRQRLHAAVDRRRHPRRRRIRRRKRVADRGGDRRADDGDGGLAAAHLHAHSAGLAGRRQRRDPDHRARGAGADQPRAGPRDDASARSRGPGSGRSSARAGLARGDRLHRRLRRGRHADRRAVARGVHRDRRRRADVRHHARTRQCRPVAARQYRARQRGGDEDDGRRRLAGRCRARRGARLRARGRRRQLSPDPGAAHPADHRDAVGELHHPVDRHLLWPRPADQAAAGLRRLHQHSGCSAFRCSRS